MPDKPHINDYLDSLRVPLAKAVDRASRAFEAELNAASKTGFGGNTIRRVLDRLQQEFESSVAAALATLKRAQGTTDLDASELRGVTAQELENFARQLRSTVQIKGLRVREDSRQMAVVEAELAKLDEHLRFALRQFDVGLSDVAAPRAAVSGGALFNASPLNRFGFNQPPHQHISRDTPLVLRTATDATPGTAPEFTGQDVTGPPLKPHRISFTGAGYDVGNNASGGELASSLPPVAEPFPPIAIEPEPLERNNAERAETLTRALATTIKQEVERLKDARPNDPDRQKVIDFLEMVSATLDEIAEATRGARLATTPQIREEKFVEAETLASSLAKAGRSFAERNYERVLDYGGYCALAILGTQLFVSLFGVPAEEAMLAQLALLGFSGTMK